MPNVDLFISHQNSVAAIRANMLETANNWKGTPYLWGGNSSAGIDCSHFVFKVLNLARQQIEATIPAPQEVEYRSTSTIEASGLFIQVGTPLPGDLILWDGHVGIVLNPVHGTFIGAQSSTGVAEGNYLSGYWSTRPGKRFLRFVHFY